MSLIEKRHSFKIKNFKRSAYNFSNGRPMEDEKLIEWMNEMYNKLIEDTSPDGNYLMKACGSSLIIAQKYFEYDNDVEYDIVFYIVDGYKELRLFNKEIGEDFEYADNPDAENIPAIFFNKDTVVV